MEAFKIKIEVMQLTLSAAVDYKKDIWIKDENHPEGGSMQKVTMLYNRPKVLLRFEARLIDQVIVAGCYYTDGKITYKALTTDLIINVDDALDEFNLPIQLLKTTSPFKAQVI